MTSEYVKSFIIGSSWPTFILYFIGVSRFDEKIKNYSYKNYTFIAPIFLGLLNVFGLWLSKKYNMNRTSRFILTGLIGTILIASFITLFKIYNFNVKKEWIMQYIKLLILYIFVFGVIVNIVDYLL
jgi:uncharacterized membrane protein SirB2